MRCEELFDDLLAYSENQAAHEVCLRVEAHLPSCSDCQQALSQLRELRLQAQQWRDENVPQWRPLNIAPPRHSRPWTQWLSLGMSSAALALVLINTDIHRDGSGLHIGWRSNAVTTMSSQELDERLLQFAKLQDSKMDTRLSSFELDGIERDKRMLRAALIYSRSQQRDDLNIYASYWQNQREQDKQQQGDVLRQLYRSHKNDLQTLKQGKL